MAENRIGMTDERGCALHRSHAASDGNPSRIAANFEKREFGARSLVARLVLLILIALSALAPGVAGQETRNTPIAFEGATLIDGTGGPAIAKSVLVIQGDRIVAVGKHGKVRYPKTARVINTQGKTIIPGLINAHGHLGLVVGAAQRADGYTAANVESELLQYEQYGVTSMLSLGLNRDLLYEIRAQQQTGEVGGASIFTADRGLGVPDGIPPLAVGSDQIYRPATPEDARADVQAMASRHADIVKLWLDDSYGKYPKMQPAIYKAIIDECRNRGLRVAAHVFYLNDAKALVRDGVDVLAHGVRDRDLDSDFIKMMKENGVLYIPTLTVDESFFVFAEHPELMSDSFFELATSPDLLKMLESREYREKVESDPNLPKYKAALDTGMRNLKTLSDAGARIAFGTDSGAFPARIPGWAEHHELELMVRAGLTPTQALTAATRGSAAVLGVSDRGTLEAGKRADFLVLAANPLNDIRNTRKIVTVWHGGREVKPRVAAPALEQ
jgi:imidazolonepropionase-like amidohydrolase